MARKLVTKNLTATATEASVAVNVKDIKLISNDSATCTLALGFDNATTGTIAISLKPGESMTDLMEIGCTTLYYKSTASCTFRFYGMA